MEDRAKQLRHRIDAYRRTLAEGGPSWLVQILLAEIARDQAELERIEVDGKK